MKVTVSVPDDLWAAVADPNEGPSHTVQTALKLMREERLRQEGPFANAPADIELNQARKTVEKLAQEAQFLRRKGYEVGLKLAEYVEWKMFDDAIKHATIEELADELAGDREPRIITDLFDNVPDGGIQGVFNEITGGGAYEQYSRLPWLGAAQALFDVHATVSQQVQLPVKRSGGAK